MKKYLSASGLCLVVFLLTLALLSPLRADPDGLLYDNLPDSLPGFDNPGEIGLYVNAGPPDIPDGQPYRAQPFWTGGLGRVASVELYIINGGTASGSLKVSLMRDDNGLPGASIAELGTVVLDDLPVWDDGNNIGALITLESTVAGLQPNSRYHIGFDNSEMTAPDHVDSASYYNLYFATDGGTEEADPHLVRPFGPWEPLSDFVQGANYMLMRISEGSPPPPIQITSFTRSATSVEISWNCQPGPLYSVEFSETHGEDSWYEIVDGLTATTASLSYEDREQARLALKQGFYRVREHGNQ